MPDTRLTDETARLAALKRYDILDSAVESGFERITQLVRTILRVPISVVSLIDADRQWFKSHAGLGVSETPRNIAFCDHTIRQRAPMVVPDAQADIRFSTNPLVTADPHIRSYVGIPLTTPDGYNVGSLCAIDTVPRQFDATQIEILEGLAGLAVEQLEWRRIAERDHLTGAMTRRAFICEMDKLVALFQRRARPASLILLDIDHFKQVNDTHGHPVGDIVIRAVADLCMHHLRSSDSLGRLGGEEFGIVMPETDAQEGARAAQRLCDAIDAMTIDHEPPLRVTASFGVASMAPGRTSSDMWMKAADAVLYDAKRSGRNCVAIAA